MPVCRYYLEGRCRFGNLCRDEHVGNGNQQRYNQQRNDNNNIYDRIGYNKGGSGAHNNNNNNNKLYDERSVRTDLTKDRPIYRYSVYGPVKDEPNLIEETDYSPEELRLQYYIIMGTFGNDASYQNGVKELENKMQMKVDSTLKDLRSALNTFESKKQQTSSFGSFGGGNTFGQQQQQQPPQQQQQQQTYGVPQNNFGATPSAYGSNTPSAFGSNTLNTFGSNTPSAFNNNPPSTYNTNPPNSFGSNIPSAYGSNTPSAFNNNPPSAFGSNQPSAFGSNSIGFPQPQPPLQFGASAFGNNSLESNQNAFGTPAAFGGGGGGGGGGFGQQSLTEQQQQQQQLFQQQQQQQQQQDLYTQQQDLYTQQQQQPPDSENLWSRNNLNLYKMPEEAPPFIFKK
ncbi:hypothetical protein Glove_208g29 [Diversispora epigaea]|uniref:C3H1-type domain-containing protein n=1 Tax=Diversispora epigaea TaxID=1348612 RepID=A0A397IQF3_9GLOM|nr:hypothetical protein Glove_208g29 [Diversispora epigaea]